ncbi:AraC family transcriptional regulator [Enterobacter ludwigii]
MILTKINIPQNLIWAISSGWKTECFSSFLSLQPVTGAELWLSTKPFHVKNRERCTFSNMQLLTPREGAFLIMPNNEKIMVLRIRHDKLYMLSREQTNTIIDVPVDLHYFWGKALMKYIPDYFDLDEDVYNGLSFVLKKLFTEKHDLKNNIIEHLYKNHVTKVSDIALTFGYTQRHIQKKFIEAHGVTIKKYQLICRIEKVIKESFQNGDIHEAMLNSGFYDQSHFIKSFQNIHSMTPTHFMSNPINNFFYNRKISQILAS